MSLFSGLIFYTLKKNSLFSKNKNMLLSLNFAIIESYLLAHLLEKISFYNLRNKISSGDIFSHIYLPNIFPTNIHTCAKFFNTIELNSLKNFLTHFDKTRFINIIHSEYFSAVDATEIIQYYNEKYQTELKQCNSKEGIKYLISSQYPIQKAIDLINKSSMILKRENKKNLKINIANVFEKYLKHNKKNYNITQLFMSLKYDLQYFIKNSLSQEEKIIFYENVLFKSLGASNYTIPFRDFFDKDHKELLSFAIWFLKEKKQLQEFFFSSLFQGKIIIDINKFLDFIQNISKKNEEHLFFINQMKLFLEKSQLYNLKIIYKKIFNKDDTINKDDIIKKILTTLSIEEFKRD